MRNIRDERLGDLYFELDAAPVYDGMAIACDRLYLSLTSGKILCLGGR